MGGVAVAVAGELGCADGLVGLEGAGDVGMMWRLLLPCFDTALSVVRGRCRWLLKCFKDDWSSCGRQSARTQLHRQHTSGNECRSALVVLIARMNERYGAAASATSHRLLAKVTVAS